MKNTIYKKSMLISLIIVISVLMFGCGKRKVVYEDEQSIGNGAGKDEEMEEGTSDSLKAMLKMPEYTTWEDTVETPQGTQYIKAAIKVPETDIVSTMTTSKWFFSNEEKKNIAEYFMDKDSIRVNVDSVYTKEKIREQIDYMESAEEQDTYYIPIDNPEFYNDSLDDLRDALEQAPSREELTQDVKDYQENFYIGKHGETEYCLTFKQNPKRNVSAFLLNRVLPDGKNAYNSYGYTNINNCKLTTEEAEKKAIAICKDLGLADMAVVTTYDLEWYTYDPNASVAEQHLDGESERNGYAIILARSIQGACVENCSVAYPMSKEEVKGDLQYPYDAERVEIHLDDEGIVSFTYQGALTKGEIKQAVHLLSFDQIQSILKTEINHFEVKYDEDTWKELKLTYLRIKVAESDDDFCYIPVWRLSHDFISDFTYYDENIYINAIDGTVIDPVMDGAITIIEYLY